MYIWMVTQNDDCGHNYEPQYFKDYDDACDCFVEQMEESLDVQDSFYPKDIVTNEDGTKYVEIYCKEEGWVASIKLNRIEVK